MSVGGRCGLFFENPSERPPDHFLPTGGSIEPPRVLLATNLHPVMRPGQYQHPREPS